MANIFDLILKYFLAHFLCSLHYSPLELIMTPYFMFQVIYYYHFTNEAYLCRTIECFICLQSNNL